MKRTILNVSALTCMLVAGNSIYAQASANYSKKQSNQIQQSTQTTIVEPTASVDKQSPVSKTVTVTEEELVLNEKLTSTQIEEVNAFIKEVAMTEIPANYVVPNYIKEADDAQVAALTVSAQHPEFSGKSGENLLKAIKANPESYKAMILEFKAVRSTFEMTK